jgi:hypothetical protein
MPSGSNATCNAIASTECSFSYGERTFQRKSSGKFARQRGLVADASKAYASRSRRSESGQAIGASHSGELSQTTTRPSILDKGVRLSAPATEAIRSGGARIVHIGWHAPDRKHDGRVAPPRSPKGASAARRRAVLLGDSVEPALHGMPELCRRHRRACTGLAAKLRRKPAGRPGAFCVDRSARSVDRPSQASKRLLRSQLLLQHSEAACPESST